MDGSKKAKDIPDFRRQNGFWMRSQEDTKTALFDTFMSQTGQGNETEGRMMLNNKAQLYEEDLMTPNSQINADILQRFIAQATESAPRSA